MKRGRVAAVAVVFAAGALAVALWPEDEAKVDLAPVAQAPQSEPVDAGVLDEPLDDAGLDALAFEMAAWSPQMRAIIERADSMTEEEFGAAIEAELERMEKEAEANEHETDPIPPGKGMGGLRLTVKRPDGSPVPGLRAMLQYSPRVRTGDETAYFHVKSQRTDASGKAFWPRLMVGQYNAHVMAIRGHSFGAGGEVVAGQVEDIQLVVPELVAIWGKVVDARGEPVEGATVYAMVAGDPDEHDARPLRPSETLEDGVFALEGLSPTTYVVIASHPQKGIGRVEARAPADGAVVKLGRGTLVHGTVADARGPVEGAQVSLKPEKQGDWNEKLMSSTTDKAGKYSLEIPAGRYLLEANADDRLMTETLDLADSEPRREVNFTFRAGGTLAGRVVDGQGKGVEGARVLIAPAGDFAARREVMARADGTFRIEGLTEEKYDLSAFKDQHWQQEGQKLRFAVGREDAVVVLLRQGRVRGRFVDAQRRPVRHFAFAHGRDVDSPNGDFELFTSTDDPFIGVSLAGEQVVILRFRVKTGETVEVGEVPLVPRPPITVTLINDKTGAPVPNVVMTLHEKRGTANQDVAYRAEGHTDAQGRMRVPGVPEPGLSVGCEHMTCRGTAPVLPGTREVTIRSPLLGGY